MLTYQTIRMTRFLASCCLCLIATTAQANIITRLNQGESLKIAAIGTSLTHPDHSYWFARTGVWLNQLYPGKVTLDNQSISGSNSFSGLNVQLPKALANSPDAVFIEFAVNDSYSTYNISQQTSANNLQTLITQINTWATDHQKQVDIVVQTMNNTVNTDRPNLAAYSQAYRDVAAANHLLLIDHYKNWLDLYDSEPDHATWYAYVPDALHPNDLGAQNVIVPEIQRALLAQVPEPNCLVLLFTSLLGLLAYGWRKRR